MAATMTAYLEQLAVSSRPATVDAASLALRQFAAHVTRTDPTCASVAAIERRHVESYKIALAARPGRDGTTTVSTETIRNNLGMVRTFFERVIDWDYPDAPRRVPVFAGDLPKAERAAPQVPRRPDRRQVHGRPGHRPQPTASAHGGAAGPHRHARR